MAATGRLEQDRLETSSVVGTDRRSNHIEEGRSRCCHSKATAGTDQDGTKIQGVSRLPASGLKVNKLEAWPCYTLEQNAHRP